MLLVDDEIAGTDVLALILAGEGLQVTVAANGHQALERLEDAAPDLLITDFMMPGMNGAELVRALRERERYRRLPVLLISGAPEAALRSYGIEYEAFLRKPFGLEQFLASVRSLLPGQAA
ncbi:response regulator [Ramlibacter tataouinensis]|uniref:response regulator n=1 Tax=Ramlibacter tataouinensis TaxID=94132 RepID=UPI0002DCC964|nr:response regulator [Ramlibacter tataouinensis]